MSESVLQAKCYIWFHNNHPELRGCLCYNLNNSRNAIDGNRNKAMGLQAGRSDMVLYYNGMAYMIEFKIPGENQKQAQVKWQKLITSQGFDYHLIDSFEDFQELIRSIIN